jgi:hypothetical protein
MPKRKLLNQSYTKSGQGMGLTQKEDAYKSSAFIRRRWIN